MRRSLQVLTLAIVVSIGAAVTSSAANAQTLIETETAVGVGATLDSQAVPDPRGMINTVKDRLRANNAQTQAQRVENRVENRIEEQNALKARLLEQRASTTQFRQELKDERKEVRQERVEQVKDIRKEYRIDAFKIRQSALVKQLKLSISNLEQIAGRVADRIGKAEASGRDMAQAKGLLAVAREKIAAAKVAVKSVENYTPSTVTATTTADDSTMVDIVKPREVGAEAIKAVKEAKESLVAIVRAIAHAMGLGNTAVTNATSGASTTAQ